MTAPRIDARRARSLDAEVVTGPDLRIVRPAAPRRAGFAALGLVLVFTVLIAVAALNTMLVSGQRNLDDLQRDIDAGQDHNQDLYLRRAELSEPRRIVAAAEAAGMVRPDETTMITVRPDGGSDVQVNRHDADDPASDAPDDERATAEADGP